MEETIRQSTRLQEEFLYQAKQVELKKKTLRSYTHTYPYA